MIALLTFSFTQQYASSEDFVKVNLSTPFQLKVNQTATLLSKGVTLQVLNISDSRCSSDVTCIWQGEAKVAFELQKNEQKTRNVISTLGENITFKSNPYLVKLVKVDPYPNSKKNIQQSDYLVTLKMLYVSPLKQFKAGIPAKDVTCADGYLLGLKSFDGLPACVKQETLTKLVQRGLLVAVY